MYLLIFILFLFSLILMFELSIAEGYVLKSTGSIQTVVTTVWTTWFGTQRLILVVSSCSIVSFLSMAFLFMPYNVIVLHFIWSNMRTVTPLFLVYLWLVHFFPFFYFHCFDIPLFKPSLFWPHMVRSCLILTNITISLMVIIKAKHISAI